MSHYVNIEKDRNEKTLPNTCSTIPDFPNYIDRNEESWYLEDFDQTQFYHTSLNLTNSNLGQIGKFFIQGD